MKRMQVRAAGLLAGLSLIGCGGSSTSPTPQPTTLLNRTLTLTAGQNCNAGGVSSDFTPTSGKTVTATATGSGSVNPSLTLYAPDFTTQLSGALGSSGRASLTFTINQTGTHHLSVCDPNGVGGSVTVTITQPA